MKKYNLVLVKLFLLFLLLTPSLAGADANTVLLLHGDETGTAIADSSTPDHPVTAVGNATQSTAQSKFGGSSLYFDGTGDYMTAPDSPDFEFGTRDFTIELWAYPTSTSGAARPLTKEKLTTISSYLIFRNGAAWKFLSSSDGLVWDIASDLPLGSVDINTWQHLAVTRQGTTFRAFKNGLQESTWESSLSII